MSSRPSLSRSLRLDIESFSVHMFVNVDSTLPKQFSIDFIISDIYDTGFNFTESSKFRNFPSLSEIVQIVTNLYQTDVREFLELRKTEISDSNRRGSRRFSDSVIEDYTTFDETLPENQVFIDMEYALKPFLNTNLEEYTPFWNGQVNGYNVKLSVNGFSEKSILFEITSNNFSRNTTCYSYVWRAYDFKNVFNEVVENWFGKYSDSR
jgi:hypothetical protein